MKANGADCLSSGDWSPASIPHLGPEHQHHRSVERHVGNAEGRPGVATTIPEDLAQEIGGAVEHLGMTTVARSAMDKAFDANDLPHISYVDADRFLWLAVWDNLRGI